LFIQIDIHVQYVNLWNLEKTFIWLTWMYGDFFVNGRTRMYGDVFCQWTNMGSSWCFLKLQLLLVFYFYFSGDFGRHRLLVVFILDENWNFGRTNVELTRLSWCFFCTWSLTFNLLTFWEDAYFIVELWWCF